MIKIGIIGTGRIAHRFVSEIESIEGIRVTVVYNPNLDSAKAFSERFQIGKYTSQLEEMCKDVDSVYIASPHKTHYKYVKYMLQHNKHVLSEKPMVCQKGQAVELFSLAKRNNCVLLEGIKTAFYPEFNEMIKMVKQGVIGDVKDIEACFSRLTPTNLREMTDEVYGGSFTEFGSYTLLPILRLLGTSIKGIDFKSICDGNGVDTYTKVFFEYDGKFALSKTGLAVKSEGQLIISGTRGYILVKSPWWFMREFEVCYEDIAQNKVYAYPHKLRGLHHEIEAFKLAIEEKVYGITGKRFAGVAEAESICMAEVMESFLTQR